MVDSSGRPIAGARVYFASAPVAVPDIAALTDPDGGFVMSAPQAGEYTVGASAEGFAPASTRVTASPGRESTVRLVLVRE